VETANRHIAVFAQIESVKGVENVEEFALHPHVSALLFGPADFSLDAGTPLYINGKPHPGVLEAAAKVRAIALKHENPAFMYVKSMSSISVFHPENCSHDRL
jgi:4-hydroxy-2-oxoheptanedioate aldolase